MHPFVRFLLLPCLLMTFQGAASADADDDIAALLHGSWSGKLGTGRTELTIVFNFSTDADGAFTVTMDSPDQGAEGIAAELDEDALPALSINIPSVFAAYSGMLYRGQIMGTFSQGGMSLPLTLTKGGLVLDRPQTPQPPFPYNTEEVRFFNAAAGATLAGTLSWPEGCDLSISGGASDCPVMAVNGSKDCQIISSLNLEAIRAKLPQDSRNLVKEYDSLNHLFQHCTTGAVTEYRSIEETVSAELLADLAGWISMNFMQ